MKPVKPLVNIALGIVLFFGAGLSEGAEDIKKTLFQNADALFEQARAKQANLLSPKNFNEALEKYKRAESALRQEKSLERIQKDLREVERRLKQALETSRLGEITFAPVLEARTQARVANASKLSAQFWNDAEEAFNDAAETLEQGDVKEAREKVEKVVSKYRKAEIDALKTNHLSEARNLLERAEQIDAGKNAPETLNQAQRFLQMAEAKLNRQDYNKTEVNQLAEQAQQSARHAVQLATEVQKQHENKNLERFILDWENRLLKISETANLDVTFQDDWNKVTDRIVEQVRTYRSQTRELEGQLADTKAQLQKLQGNVNTLETQLEDRRKARERVAAVESLFEEDEAAVLQKGNTLIIRLYGLHFRTGKADIEPVHYDLLSKVHRAIKQFPEAMITVEGHTDSYGEESANRTLSENRALAVREYLLANSDLSSLRIEAVGLGEKYPIAPNETQEGRSKNRRIDITFHLNGEQPSLGARKIESNPTSD